MSETVQTLTTAPAAPAKGAGATATPDPLRDAAQEFEAVFLAQLLSQLNPPAAGDGAAGGGDHGLFHDMFNEEMAKLISRSGGIGVADAVLKEMLKLQEVA
jgi:Rod binding domain-containing protein